MLPREHLNLEWPPQIRLRRLGILSGAGQVEGPGAVTMRLQRGGNKLPATGVVPSTVDKYKSGLRCGHHAVYPVWKKTRIVEHEGSYVRVIE
jgi:hypothetical protein